MKTPKMKLPKLAKSGGKLDFATFMKSVAIIAIFALLTYVALYFFIVVQPINKVDKLYEEQEKLIGEIIDRTPAPTVLKTNAELQSLTDDEVFQLLQNIGSSAEMLENFDNSFAVFADSWLDDYDSAIEYSQLVSISNYVKNYCGSSDLNEVNLSGAVTDYVIDMAAITFFEKATPAINSLYDSYYADYAAIEKHTEVTTPLQANGLVERIVADETLKSRLNANSNAINRIVQAEYAKTTASYEAQCGSATGIQAIFFDVYAESIEDLVDLRMLACDEYFVSGTYLPMNISDADSELISTSRNEARAALIECNKRFNMTADADGLTGWAKFCQAFASSSIDSVFDKLANYNKLELGSYLHSPKQFTEAQISKYTRDYVFWNLIFGTLTFVDATEQGAVVANLNYKANSMDYGFIEGGNMLFPEDELQSLLWATAEQNIIATVYSNCKLTTDAEGNIVAEDTNDELVAAYRNWFEVWNLWGSQFTQ